MTEATNNGERRSSTEAQSLNKKISELYNIMEGFQKEIGSPNPKNNYEEVSECFEWSRTEIESLSYERCAEVSLQLQLHSFYLKKKINRLRAVIGWLESEINMGVGKVTRDYDGQFRDKLEKRAMIIIDNVYLSRVNEYLEQFKIRLHAIESDCYHIDNICGAIKNIQYTKRGSGMEQRTF